MQLADLVEVRRAVLHVVDPGGHQVRERRLLGEAHEVARVAVLAVDVEGLLAAADRAQVAVPALQRGGAPLEDGLAVHAWQGGGVNVAAAAGAAVGVGIGELHPPIGVDGQALAARQHPSHHGTEALVAR